MTPYDFAMEEVTLAIVRVAYSIIDSERAIRDRAGICRCTAGLPEHAGAIFQASASSDGA